MSIMVTLTITTCTFHSGVRHELVSRQLPTPIMADSAGSSGGNSSIGLKASPLVVTREPQANTSIRGATTNAYGSLLYER